MNYPCPACKGQKCQKCENGTLAGWNDRKVKDAVNQMKGQK